MTDKRWAVSYINWYDHELTTVIVESESWHEALRQHPKLPSEGIDYTSITKAKRSAFNMDSMVEVVEIIP